MNYRSDTYYHSKGSVAVKIAITGKGGVGKTTLAAGLINLFAQRGFQVYAVDADPDVSLGTTLGVPEETLAAQPPLVEMRELIKERTGAQGGFFVLNPQVDDVLDKYSIDIGNIKLLRMGGYKNAGSSCYCPENAFLNAIVNSLLLGNKDVVILDFGAGIEHLTRGTARGVDLMLIVTEPTKVSVYTAKVIQTLSSEMEISDVKVVGNKVRTEKEKNFLTESFAPEGFLGIVQYNEELWEKSMMDDPQGMESVLVDSVSSLFDGIIDEGGGIRKGKD
jgi:CO dehydrogenase maturation factor